MAGAESLLNVVTTTLNAWSEDVYDNVTNNNALLYYFKKFGKLGLVGEGNVKMGSIETRSGGKQIEEDIKEYHANYKLKEIDKDTIKYIVKDGGYNPDETDTPEFETNLSDLTPCNRFITSFSFMPFTNSFFFPLSKVNIIFSIYSSLFFI